MAVYNFPNALPQFKNAVITIGSFDGVHIGHSKIIEQLVTKAKEQNGESIVITFDPHPRKIIFPNEAIEILTPLQEKIALLEEAGVDHIVIAAFTTAFSKLSAEDYIRDFIVQHFHPSAIVIGYDHKFGHDRAGDINMLRSFANEYNYEVAEIPAELIAAAAVSSTKIRNALTEGRLHDAAEMLGRSYKLSGTVISGKQLGRTIGYPTANIFPTDKEQLIPAKGVYAVHTWFDGLKHDAMMSIGFNPTVTDEEVLKLEAFIFDFDKDIYGKEITIEFVQRLRDEIKFDSLEALKTQIDRDGEEALKVLR